jgi:hypothetical protein
VVLSGYFPASRNSSLIRAGLFSIEKLGRTHKWLLSLASRSSEMHEQLKHDISAIEHEIRVAKESQAKLDKWEVGSIRRDPITDPFVGYTRQILITTTDDLELHHVH